jgi:hypothetical protein
VPLLLHIARDRQDFRLWLVGHGNYIGSHNAEKLFAELETCITAIVNAPEAPLTSMLHPAAAVAIS